jgi:GNAT superfamily N-acetyltransferase
MRRRGGGRFFQDFASGALRRENLEVATLAWLKRLPDGDEDEDAADELRGLGIDADTIEAARDQAEAFNGEDSDGEVVVWTENRHIVEVFTRCHWRTQILAGASEAVRLYEGIEAPEIAAVAAMVQVPAEAMADLLWGVRVMEATALPLLNRP